MGCLPRPKLRGQLASAIKLEIFGALAVSFTAGFLVKIFLKDRHAKLYSDYYKDYDPEVAWDQMKDYFQSEGNWNAED